MSGKALEAVEHLSHEEYYKKDGEKVLFELLDARFPQKETADEMAEVLGGVFALRINEGENMKQWTARATELLDRCQRKVGVAFPDEARGWLLLNRAGLSDGERAVVIARATGSLKRDKIAASLRSCFPDYVAKRRSAVALTEELLAVEHDLNDEAAEEHDFSDVQQFLQDHPEAGAGEDSTEAFAEADVAEVLALSWKERRSELSKIQKGRKFNQNTDLRRSFRIEVEELKKKTKCNKCGKIGHWARECRSKVSSGDKGTGKSAQASSSSSTSGAATVSVLPTPFEDFVAAVTPVPSMLQQLRQLQQQRADHDFKNSSVLETLLVSSPGYGVLDSGCGRTIIGESTLREFEQLWKAAKIPSAERSAEVHHFRFGNGQTEVSTMSVSMPMVIAGKRGKIRAAVVKGAAPLLISRSALQSLKAQLNFADNTVTLFEDHREVPLQVNEAGQYVLNVLEMPDSAKNAPSSALNFEEVMMSSPDADPGQSVSHEPQQPECEVPLQTSDQVEPLKVWYQYDFGSNETPQLSNDGPKWKHVHRRIIRDAASQEIIRDDMCSHMSNQQSVHFRLPRARQDVVTEFWHDDPSVSTCDSVPETQSDVPWLPSVHQLRQLEPQVKACAQVAPLSNRCLVMEVFSPPRFATQAEAAGFRGRSFDIKQGWDLSTAKHRRVVEDLLVRDPPDLLVLCPPCTHEGGWWYLNRHKMSQTEFLKCRAQSRSFIRWCCKLFRLQVQQGRRAVFEHSLPSQVWGYDEMRTLLRRHFTVKLHQCRYGLRLPESPRLIRKGTRLLLSHEDMKCLGLECPGKNDPKHAHHDVVAGSCPGIPSISAFAGQYPPKFVEAVLQCVPRYRQQCGKPVAVSACEFLSSEPVSHECLANEDVSVDDLQPIIARLHKNLGHPSKEDLLRVLRNANASEPALQAAKKFECDFCLSQARPKVALPAQTNRVCDFNHQLGCDVKYLTGWKSGQKVSAVNMVDQASGFQRMVPFFQTETSSVLSQVLHEHWIAPFGPPKEIVLDPARTNLGEGFVGPAESLGIHIRPIAAGAHYQLGKTESHGGWFDRILQKLIVEHAPSNQEEWLTCVSHAHVKNQMLQVHGYSPHQYVFGKNPQVPSDLLNEPIQIVPATASLMDDAAARAQALRLTARKAVIELQDDKAIRLALNARPRKAVDFQPGDYVCYWRHQKWVKGKLQQGGRWYGCAIVLGTVGRNIVLMHRRQVIRAAPEQVRLATSEERTVIAAPQAELLGIKDLIDKGQLKSQQFVDLVPESYPTEETPCLEPREHAPLAPTAGVSADAKEMHVGDRPSDVPDVDMPPLSSPAVVDKSPLENQDDDQPVVPTLVHDHAEESLPSSSSAESSYGPVRRRVTGKNGPPSLWRPLALQPEDFSEIMQELIPHLIDEATKGTKRDQPDTGPAADAVPSPAGQRQRVTETLSVQDAIICLKWVMVLARKFLLLNTCRSEPKRNCLIAIIPQNSSP